MREDMDKVIVERPRRGGGNASKGRWREHAFDGPMQEGMRRRHSERKSLNENLAPLRRFLESRVGKYWPKVYAEISAQLRPSNAVQQHVRDHLRDFVATRTSLGPEGILVHNYGYRGGIEPLSKAGHAFFVHPVSSVLLRTPHRRRWAPSWAEQRQARAVAAASRLRVLDDTRQLHKLRGCWFEVTLAPLPSDGPVTDVVIDPGLAAIPRHELYGRRDRRAIAKRQLGRKELAQHGLGNDA